MDLEEVPLVGDEIDISDHNKKCVVKVLKRRWKSNDDIWDSKAKILLLCEMI